MKKMLNFVSKNAVKLVTVGVIVAVALWLKNKFFKNSAMDKEYANMTAETARTMGENMHNGMTYTQCAQQIVELIYRHAIFSNWRNVDEEAVGRIMLTVHKEEWNKLVSVYSYVKKKYFSDMLFAFGNDGTLIDDLDSCFSNAETKQYLSHLL